MIVETADDDLLAARLARPEMRYFDPMLAELWNLENNEYRALRDRKDRFTAGHSFHKQIVKGLHDNGVVILAGLYSMSSRLEEEQEMLRQVLRLVPHHAQARLRLHE